MLICIIEISEHMNVIASIKLNIHNKSFPKQSEKESDISTMFEA